jgi:hypothetical protein
MVDNKYSAGTIETRRQEASRLSGQAETYYRSYWDVEHVADVEENRQELSDTEDRTATQLLECADIDKIVDTYQKQIPIQEKFVFSETGDSLSIRIENNRGGVHAEAERLKNSLSDPTILTPTVFGFGKVADDTFDWFYLISVHKFIREWLDGSLDLTLYASSESDVNNKLFFSRDDIEASGVVLQQWDSEVE